MADQFRDQINTARRAGYSDDEIVQYLKDKDPRVTKALEAGYKPVEIVDYLAPKPTMGEEVARKTGVAVRGASEALAPVTAGALGGAALGLMTGVGAPVAVPVGALAGSLAVPTMDVLTAGYNKLLGGNVRMPSQVISEMLPGPRAESPAERVLQASTGALTSTGGSIAAGRGMAQAAGAPAGVTAIGREASRLPRTQIVAAPVATAIGQTTTEATDSPLAGLAAGMGASMIPGMRPTKRELPPSVEDVMARSKANYEILDKSGLQFDTQQFQQHMGSIPAKLRREVGYVKSVNPKVAGAFDELMASNPKDVAELGALRKIIGNAAETKEERKVAMMLLDEFDDYVLNAPASAVVGGDRKAVEAWKAARADYAKVKKAELLQDIVSRAEVSQSGKEVSIAQGLSALAKNDKKMRFFSPDEREAIREAAKGGDLQLMLRTIGKFTPMTPAAAIFTAVSPFGAYTAAAGLVAKSLATKMRERSVGQLTDQMLLGKKPEVLESPFVNEPVFFSRGVQNMLGPVQQNQNALTR